MHTETLTKSLTRWVPFDKMNDENEKIIDIDTRFLEEAMQAEVDRG